MTDTPQHVKDIQLKLWLAKTPEERLMQFLKDNDEMYKAILQAKKELNIAFIQLKTGGIKKILLPITFITA